MRKVFFVFVIILLIVPSLVCCSSEKEQLQEGGAFLYNVVYESGEGEGERVEFSFESGSQFVVENLNFKKSGYVFKCYSDGEKDFFVGDIVVMGDSNLTLVAQFEIEEVQAQNLPKSSSRGGGGSSSKSSNENQPQKLESPKNLTIDKDNAFLQFDAVKNADFYQITVGKNVENYTYECFFDLSKLITNGAERVCIIAKSKDDCFESSEPSISNFYIATSLNSTNFIEKIDTCTIVHIIKDINLGAPITIKSDAEVLDLVGVADCKIFSQDKIVFDAKDTTINQNVEIDCQNLELAVSPHSFNSNSYLNVRNSLLLKEGSLNLYSNFEAEKIEIESPINKDCKLNFEQKNLIEKIEIETKGEGETCEIILKGIDTVEVLNNFKNKLDISLNSEKILVDIKGDGKVDDLIVNNSFCQVLSEGEVATLKIAKEIIAVTLNSLGNTIVENGQIQTSVSGGYAFDKNQAEETSKTVITVLGLAVDKTIDEDSQKTGVQIEYNGKESVPLSANLSYFYNGKISKSLPSDIDITSLELEKSLLNAKVEKDVGIKEIQLNTGFISDKYLLYFQPLTVEIVPKQLEIDPPRILKDKIYDGTKSVAPQDIKFDFLRGVADGDSVSFVPSYQYNSSEAGDDLTLKVSYELLGESEVVKNYLPPKNQQLANCTIEKAMPNISVLPKIGQLVYGQSLDKIDFFDGEVDIDGKFCFEEMSVICVGVANLNLIFVPSKQYINNYHAVSREVEVIVDKAVLSVDFLSDLKFEYCKNDVFEICNTSLEQNFVLDQTLIKNGDQVFLGDSLKIKFEDENANADKKFSLLDFTLMGEDSKFYDLKVKEDERGEIFKKQTYITIVDVIPKFYDGSNQCDTENIYYDNFWGTLEGDDVFPTIVSANYNSPQIGLDKEIEFKFGLESFDGSHNNYLPPKPFSQSNFIIYDNITISQFQIDTNLIVSVCTADMIKEILYQYENITGFEYIDTVFALLEFVFSQDNVEILSKQIQDKMLENSNVFVDDNGKCILNDKISVIVKNDDLISYIDIDNLEKINQDANIAVIIMGTMDGELDANLIQIFDATNGFSKFTKSSFKVAENTSHLLFYGVELEYLNIRQTDKNEQNPQYFMIDSYFGEDLTLFDPTTSSSDKFLGWFVYDEKSEENIKISSINYETALNCQSEGKLKIFARWDKI